MEQREAGDGEESPEDRGGGGYFGNATRRWRPKEEHLEILLNMGISRKTAENALFLTGDQSPDLAAAYIFEHPDEDLESYCVARDDDDSDDEDEDVYKMVFVVNKGLEMGVGKVAAQVAHAALGVYRVLLQDENKYGDMLLRWEEFGETKIVLQGSSTQHLVELEKKAMLLGLPTYLVQDAGKTQVPVGSTTVLSIMGRVNLVDKVTGSLRLL